MKSFQRVVVMVADGLGVGAAPDAAAYGDVGSNTFGNTLSAVGGLSLSTLEKLGMGCLGNFDGVARVSDPKAIVGRLAERSEGKDTTTGHWEIAGLVTTKPFAVFPDGFPGSLLERFVDRADIPGVMGNYAASGTEILRELGEVHVESGLPIVYTSADSVFQIAAHEEAFGLERLYQICEIAREVTLPYQVGRVIARPFIGSDAATFTRTENRRDYSIAPERNLLDVLQDRGIDVLSVGKIEDIFCHRGITSGNHTGNNADSLAATYDYLVKSRGKPSFIFTNLVDFDQLYGHRRDPKGFAQALVSMDEGLPKILSELQEDDCFILTGDHGCDPTYKGTDHTREYVPLVAYAPGRQGSWIGDRGSFSDIAATLLQGYGIQDAALAGVGESFLWR